MGTIKKLMKNWKIWLLIFFLLFSFLWVSPQFDSGGVIINSVEENSSASIAGINSPSAETAPTEKERILEINGLTISNMSHYYDTIETLEKDTIVRVLTDKEEYALFYQENQSIGLVIAEAPGSNIRMGLDLQGGTRVMIQPQGENLTSQDVQDVIDTISNRLNVYGLSDLTIRSASDLEGTDYIIVEIAGATKEDVKELIGTQGQFEARIGGEVAFSGGDDVTFVCRTDGTCSRIAQCDPTDSGYQCRFEFEISLSEEAAKRQAGITAGLEINATDGGRYLSKQLDFVLDNVTVDSLNIGADLKGQTATNILISGPGYGDTQEEAIENALAQRNKLQTYLITGSLPTQIEIVKLDSISPILGQEFLDNAILVGALALLAVIGFVFIRYRSWKIVLPMAINLVSEIVIILGLAALFKYNLDLAAIAGIIAAVGTGVDDQIVIIDETLKNKEKSGSMTSKIKRAFFIILVAYATTVAAMLPLVWAGAGLLTGFAIVTITGVTVGVLITRPAFSAMIKTIMEK
jgi:preprotein translocase subunit SecD